MKTYIRMVLGLLVVAVAPTQLPGQQRTGTICGNPATECSSSYSFSSYQLAFQIREKLVFGKTYKSLPVYAVILKSVKTSGAEDCVHVSEEERLEVQALITDRKVFASRVSCPEELILYSNVSQDVNFLAVYAGANFAEAKTTLKLVKATGRYRQAYIRRMQVVLEFST